MTWTAPQIDRATEPTIGEERTILEGYLDWHRETLLFKCAGLTPEQLKLRAVEPSNLSLLGLVRHMGECERWWFRRRTAKQDLTDLFCTEASPDGDFDDIDTADAEADFAAFNAECQAAREAVVDIALEFTFLHPRSGDEMSLRWVYVHMIEEYARHNGHADLLRERIDGVTGA